MTLQQTHTCDRCNDQFLVPESSTYELTGSATDDIGFADPIELCYLCKDALKSWFSGQKLVYPGVVEHEAKYVNEVNEA